jgi:6-phosphogluconolactonase
MKELSSSYGRVFIGSKEDCFRTAVFVAEGQRGQMPPRKHFTWALTGGSTPKEWYQWCVAKDALSPTTLATTHWFVSDRLAFRRSANIRGRPTSHPGWPRWNSGA